MIKVLFACVENSCRSQMAEGFMHLLGGGMIEAYSAGSKPSSGVHAMAIEAMLEAGVDISRYRSKSFSDLAEKNFDYVITMGCGDECPIIQAKYRFNWCIDDPSGRKIDFFRKVRDDIKVRVEELARRIISGR